MCVRACWRVRDPYDVISAVLFTCNPVSWLVGRAIEHIPATTTVNASSREKESIAMQYTLYTNAKEKTWER